MIDFTNRVALVTGGGRGLGLAYATALAARGATVVVHDVGADPSGKGGDPAVAETATAGIVGRGGRAVAASGRISTREECSLLVSRVAAEHGRLDILVHNAGWVGYQAIEALEPGFLDRMMNLGVHASLWLSQAAWPIMRARSFGRILLTTSDRAIYPEHAQAGLAAYAAAKMAVVGIVNTLSVEGRSEGILVNAVSPVAKTRMWEIEEEPDDLHPNSVAPGVLYLVSSECFATGWVLRAANGMFAATQAREAAGVDYPQNLRGIVANTPEAVGTSWPRIAVSRPEQRS